MFDIIIGFFRDTISGTYYVIYAILLLTLMFSIIGYMFKQKYAKVEFKLNPTTNKKNSKPKKNNKQVNATVAASKTPTTVNNQVPTSATIPAATTLAAANVPLPSTTGTAAKISDVTLKGK